MEPESIVLVDTWDKVQAACAAIAGCHVIAFDLEGVNLGLNGMLTVLQVAIHPRTVFCFDVLVLGQGLFAHHHLGSIFASFRTVKLCFDCRVDGEVLQRQLGVQLNLLYDVQILYTLLFQSPRDPFLKGLHRVMQMPGVVESEGALNRILQSKRRIKDALGRQQHIFFVRPLTAELLQYCGCDVYYLLRMHRLWHQQRSTHLILEATRARLNRFCARDAPIPSRQMSVLDFRVPGGAKARCAPQDEPRAKECTAAA
jgi:hypothetical protein